MTREEAIDHLSVIAERMDDKGRMIYVGDVALEAVDMAIEALQERKVGKWIGDNGKEVFLDEFGNTEHSSTCSVCGDWLVGSDEYGCRGRYCPNCGARMEVYNDTGRD